MLALDEIAAAPANSEDGAPTGLSETAPGTTLAAPTLASEGTPAGVMLCVEPAVAEMAAPRTE
jgi:hypothetical protein